jgi:hypothetical protein
LWRHEDGTSHHRRQDPLALQLPAWDPATTVVLFPQGPATPIIGPHGALTTPAPGNSPPAPQQARQQQQHGSSEPEAPPGAAGPPPHGDPTTLPAPRTAEPQPSPGAAAAAVAASPGAACVHATPSFKRVVVLEGSWQKARGLLRHPSLRGLRCVQLPPDVRTAFWRRGEGTFRGAVDHGVCTIEAVWHLVKLLQPERCWDDLLWLFAYQRELVAARGSRRTRANMAACIAPLPEVATGR